MVQIEYEEWFHFLFTIWSDEICVKRTLFVAFDHVREVIKSQSQREAIDRLSTNVVVDKDWHHVENKSKVNQ